MDNFVDPGWLGVALGALGVVFGLAQLLRRSGPQVAYQQVGQKLIEATGQRFAAGVRVLFNDEEVPRIALTQVVVWNAGRGPLRSADLATADPLRIELPEDASVLQAEVVKRTNEANRVQLGDPAGRPQSLRIAADYLNPSDGVLLRVLHTGSSTRLSCEGTVIGMNHPPSDLGRIPVPVRSLRRRMSRIRGMPGPEAVMATVLSNRRLVFTIAAVVGLSALVLAAVNPVNLATATGIESFRDFDRTLLTVIGLIYGLPPLFLLWVDRRRFPSSIIPDELVPENEREKEAQNQ